MRSIGIPSGGVVKAGCRFGACAEPMVQGTNEQSAKKESYWAFTKIRVRTMQYILKYKKGCSQNNCS